MKYAARLTGPRSVEVVFVTLALMCVAAGIADAMGWQP